MQTSPTALKGAGRAKAKNGAPPTATVETAIHGAVVFLPPPASPTPDSAATGTEPREALAANHGRSISRTDPLAKGLFDAEITATAGEAKPSIVTGSTPPIDAGDRDVSVSTTSITGARAADDLSSEKSRRFSASNASPGPVAEAPQPATNGPQRVGEPSATVIAGDGNKAGFGSAPEPAPGNLEPRKAGLRSDLQEAEPSALAPSPRYASRVEVSAEPNANIQTAMTTASPISMSAVPALRAAAPQEFQHRFSPRSTSSESVEDVQEGRRSSLTAIAQLGQIPGVAGTLRLDRDRNDGRESADAPANEYATASPTPSLVGTSVGPKPEAISVAPPVASPQWATAFGAAVVQLTANEIGEATLTLTPDELGTISVKIGIEGSLVSVGFNAENKDVRDAVAASMPMLQDMLARSGLSLGQSSVGRETANGGGSRPQSGSSQPAATAVRSVLRSESTVLSRRTSHDSLVDTFA
jgi:flagellar hook-length control protein FliK